MQMARCAYYLEISKINAVRSRNERSISVIQEIFECNKDRYGVRRVYNKLVNRGHNVNHKRVQRLMHDMKLFEKHQKKNTILTKAALKRSKIIS